jgi:TatD DNase family protein
MFIDSHCHLASHRFSKDEVPGLIDRALAAGIDRMVTLATRLDDVPANLEIAHHPAVHACVGIHPCDVHHAPDDALEQLAAFVSDPRVCAIGETGLDYYHPAPEGWTEENFRKRQRDFLDRHFQLAAKAGLNVVIHTRDATGRGSFEDALEIYRNHHERVRAVFHCFAGSSEDALEVIGLGGLVSFGGVLTFKNAQSIRDTLISCRQGTFMLETDSPYLAPEPHRGQRNEPAFVRHVAEAAALLRGESPEELARHTNETADKFFRFRSKSI